ncbi:MAG: hypothetical protein Q8O11_08725, partial [Syntrophales bacterium]|nr:hypothetical protein [Syntrophales bacterium]
MIIQNSPALVPLLLLAAAISIPVLAIKKTSVAYPVAMAASLFSVMISAYNMFRVWESGPLTYHFGGWIPPIGIEYVLDSLSAFVALVVNVVAFIVLCHAGGLKERDILGKAVPYYSLV